MQRQKHLRFPIFILIIMFMLLSAMAAIHFEKTTAKASSADYTISSWRKKNVSKMYYSAQEGCTYVISLVENHDFPVQKIFYSAYQVSIQEENIGYDDENNITNPFAKDMQGNDIDKVEIINIQRGDDFNEQRQRIISFEVTVYEWSACVFYTQWDNLGETIEEEGDFLYCTNIDNSPPNISLTAEPILQDNGFVFNYAVRANEYTSDRTANSGFKKVTVYRKLTEENSQPENIQVYEQFTNSLMFYGQFLAIKGEYFIEAIDGVNNKKTVRVINIDYDINHRRTIDNVETMLSKQADYKKELIDNLKEKYVKWQIMYFDDYYTQAQLEEAYNDTLEALTICGQAKKEFKVKVINNFYVGDVTVENFDSSTYADIVYGETITMNISLAEYQNGNNKFDEIFSQSKMKSAEKILAINVELTSDMKELAFSQFVEPIKISIPLSKYKNISAVSESLVNGQTVYSQLRVDKGDTWVMVYVPQAQTTVNLVIQQNNAADNLKWLYLLLLLVPIALGVVLFVYKNKIFSKLKKVVDSMPTEDEQTQDEKDDKKLEEQHNSQPIPAKSYSPKKPPRKK